MVPAQNLSGSNRQIGDAMTEPSLEELEAQRRGLIGELAESRAATMRRPGCCGSSLSEMAGAGVSSGGRRGHESLTCGGRGLAHAAAASGTSMS